MKFPWNLFEPVLIPLVDIAVAQGFTSIPEKFKPFLATAVSAFGSELVAWAAKTPTSLDDAAVNKLKGEVAVYLNGKGCAHLPAELDKLFAM